MEKLKRFKKAGVKAIASALVLGLGAGLFAGCNPSTNVEKLPEPEFNEQLYNNLISSNELFNEEYFENIKADREKINAWFKDPNVFGGLIDDYDEILRLLPYTNQDGNEFLMFVYALKDGRQKEYVILNQNLLENGFNVDKLSQNPLVASYEDSYKAIRDIETLEDLIKTNSIDYKNLKVVSSSFDIEDELTQKTNELIYNPKTNDTTNLEKLGLLEYVENGYDIYICNRYNPYIPGIQLSFKDYSEYEDYNKSVTIHYVLSKNDSFSILYWGNTIDYDTATVSVKKQVSLIRASAYIICINEETGDIKSFKSGLQFSSKNNSTEHLYNGKELKEYNQIKKDADKLKVLWYSEGKYSTKTYKSNSEYEKLLNKELRAFLNSNDLDLMWMGGFFDYDLIEHESFNKNDSYIYDIVNGFYEDCKVVDANEFAKINNTENAK